MRPILVLLLVAAASTLAACDANSSCPATGTIAVTNLVVGTGDDITTADSVLVRWVGRLALGRAVYDSTAGPTWVVLRETEIPGFRSGLAGEGGIDPMRVGGRRSVFVPANFAYGDDERPGIPACSDLLLDIRLLDVSP